MTTKKNATKQNGMHFKRIRKAYSYSMQGLKAAFRHEAAFSEELLLIAIMLPIGMWVSDNNTERSLLIGSLFLILIIELLNSAIEAVVDRIGSEHHELSGRAKDLGSAAVFLTLVNAAIIWLLILCG
ncbi:diacylglycerol kinase [Desulfobulbus sp. TB]|nr:diacylglycerol kinase [Desulfobulbus sp. TB]